MNNASRPVLADMLLSSPEATADVAIYLADRVGPGDVLCLDGDLGAGKSHFARSLIRHRQTVAEDIPSPTFTLVQTYDTPGAEIWHADLYRLSDPWDVEELGLLDAFDTALCLVEWPDRLGADLPERALWIGLAMVEGQEDARRLTLSTARPDLWTGRLDGLAPA